VLKAPSSERARFAQALSASRRANKLIGQLIIAVRAGDRARIAALALAANTSDIQTRTAASALGLTACAKAVEPRGAS
jgi:putative Ca2+/H+ antiporter (TMEM165/GDT1 family)